MGTDKLEYEEGKGHLTEEEKQKRKIYIRFLIIGAFVGYITLVIVMFAVPRSRYNKAKKEHEMSKKPSKTIIAFYFVNHILCLCLLISVLTRSFLLIFMLAILTGIFWILNVVFGFVYTINPGKTEYDYALNEHVKKANTTKLMGYVYAYGYVIHKRSRSYGYTKPYVFKATLSNFITKNFSIPNRNMFGYEFNFKDTTDYNANVQISYGKTETAKVFPHFQEHIVGFYPDIKGVNYFSKTGKLSGKYGQVARVFAGIFGFGTYYDHTTSAIPHYSSTIYRDIAGSKDINPYQDYDYFLRVKPNLKKYYDNLYK